jgi:hypothetical protein
VSGSHEIAQVISVTHRPGAVRRAGSWAQQEFRSVNGQIEFLLREAVSRRRHRRDTDSSPPPPDEPAAGDATDDNRC